MFTVRMIYPSIKAGLKVFADVSQWGMCDAGNEIYRRAQDLSEKELMYKAGQLCEIVKEEAGKQCHNDSVTSFTLQFGSGDGYRLFRSDYGHEVEICWYLPFERPERFPSVCYVRERTKERLVESLRRITNIDEVESYATTIKVGEDESDWRSWRSLRSKTLEPILSLVSDIMPDNFKTGFLLAPSWVDSEDGQKVLQQRVI